ncbi:MAG: hypothetical protein WD231_03670 [Candidatus Woykebacteria bacterium]
MSKQIELIRQALSAAESSIGLAKQLLADVDSGKGSDDIARGEKKVFSGVIGTFDGENMVTKSGEKFPVPSNYASKSALVVGDTLKMVDERGEKKFKQIEHVKRLKTRGVLTKKDGKFHVVAPEGSYKVLPAAVEHSGASVGVEVSIWLPAQNLTASWAALESQVKGEEKNKDIPPKSKEEPLLEEKKNEEDERKQEVKPSKPVKKVRERQVIKEEAKKVEEAPSEVKEEVKEAPKAPDLQVFQDPQEIPKPKEKPQVVPEEEEELS